MERANVRAEPRKVILMGAAGRDFHNFNVAFRGDPDFRVVAFTATQIPGIEGRSYPTEIAGALYPEGIPIVPEDELEKTIRRFEADEVIFAYSDVSHETVMHLASRVLATGADFRLQGPKATMVDGDKPSLAICATRTGCGKSQTTRALAGYLGRAGYKVAVVRHPMPYGDLVKQRIQRFAKLADLDEHDCTIEEREEYEPHIAQGSIVFAGVDYEAIREAADEEADVILWDGGNNDLPFYTPQLFVTVTDPLRAGNETGFHPGETNLRMADVVVINKIDSATREQIDVVRSSIAAVNPAAKVIEARSILQIDGDHDLAGKRVLVVDDGPTLTHGQMGYGAGVVAAERAGATLVDPRPWATGSIEDVFERFPHIGNCIPAMGYSEKQRRELEETINAADADLVVVGTPIDLRKVLRMNKPAVRVRYDLEPRAAEELLALALERLPAPWGPEVTHAQGR